jgi:hypothetical protein
MQDLTLARQALYHLNDTPSSFCFRYFLNRVSHLCPDWPELWSPIYVSCVVAEMTGMHHQTQLFISWNGVHTAQAGLEPWSWVASITGVNHRAQLTSCILMTGLSSCLPNYKRNLLEAQSFIHSFVDSPFILPMFFSFHCVARLVLRRQERKKVQHCLVCHAPNPQTMITTVSS